MYPIFPKSNFFPSRKQAAGKFWAGGEWRREGKKSVMIFAGNNYDIIFCYLIHEAVLFGNPPAPRTLKKMFKRFGFTNTAKRVALTIVNDSD